MNVTITARHCELSNDEKSFIKDRVNNLLRFHSKIIETHVTVIEEKHRQRAEIKVKINHNVFFSEAESKDLRMSVEQVVQKLQRQIKKYKGRSRRRVVGKEELVSISRDTSFSDEEEEDVSIEPVVDGDSI